VGEGPVLPFGVVGCEGCGRSLWYLTAEGRRVFFRYAEARFVRELFAAIPEQQRLPRWLGADGLDVVELVMEFEEALEEAG
jgi:hypothetical protein